MPSQRSNINRALGHIGSDAVLSQAQLEADPPSTVVSKVLQHYADAADTAQARACWLCCEESRLIDVDADIPGEPGLPFAFRLPVGALHVYGVGDSRIEAFGQYAPDWRQGTWLDPQGAGVKVVFAASPGPAAIRYTRRTPEAVWDPLLVEAFALELGAALAGPIKADGGLGQQLRNRARDAYMTANASEAVRSGPQRLQGLSGMAAARASAH